MKSGIGYCSLKVLLIELNSHVRLCFSEKMPNTLDDSEDFIADTPPAQIKKHQWRDITTEKDLKKVFE